MGLPEEFRISVLRTFGTGFDVGESIFWALKKSGQVFVEVVESERVGVTFGIFRTFRCPYRLENCLISRRKGRSTKRRMFIVSDRADGYFVSSPWSGTVRFC